MLLPLLPPVGVCYPYRLSLYHPPHTSPPGDISSTARKDAIITPPSNKNQFFSGCYILQTTVWAPTHGSDVCTHVRAKSRWETVLNSRPALVEVRREAVTRHHRVVILTLLENMSEQSVKKLDVLRCTKCTFESFLQQLRYTVYAKCVKILLELCRTRRTFIYIPFLKKKRRTVYGQSCGKFYSNYTEIFATKTFGSLCVTCFYPLSTVTCVYYMCWVCPGCVGKYM